MAPNTKSKLEIKSNSSLDERLPMYYRPIQIFKAKTLKYNIPQMGICMLGWYGKQKRISFRHLKYWGCHPLSLPFLSLTLKQEKGRSYFSQTSFQRNFIM